MFKMFKKDAPVPPASIPDDGIPFLTANDLLSPHAGLLKKVRNDSGATKEFFDTYYRPVLERYAEILQLRPFGHEGKHAVKGGAIEVAIKRVSLALKLRLGALLPLNCRPEEISHRGECWTYGLFITALMRDFGGQNLGVKVIGFDRNDKPAGEWLGWCEPITKYHHYRMKKVAGTSRTISYTSSVLHLRDVIPQAGLEWLYSDLELMDCMLDVLSGAYKIHDNALQSLIVKASSTLRDEISFEAALETVADEVHETEPETKPGEVIDKETGEVKTVAKKPVSQHQPTPAEPPSSAVEKTPSEPSDDDKNIEAGEKVSEQQESDTAQQAPSPQPSEPASSGVEEPVTAHNFVPRLKADIRKNRISPEYATKKGNYIEVRYPTTFRSYTDSPSQLLNDLRLNGVIQQEMDRKGTAIDRVIILRG